MTPDEFKRHFAGIKIQLDKAIQRELPIKIGNKAVKMFKQNFVNEGYFGEKWKDVRRRTNPPKHSHRPDNAHRKILTGTGALGRKIKLKIEPATALVYSPLDYAEIHNEGGRTRHAVIPKRQFMGAHQDIKKMAVDTINGTMNDIFKKL